MADFTIKSFDRRPKIQATLGRVDGTVVDLTNALSIDFIMRSKTTNLVKVNAPAVVIDAPAGVVRYDWAIGDTDTPGAYLVEWEVQWPGDEPETFPTLQYNTLDVVADLDADSTPAAAV